MAIGFVQAPNAVRSTTTQQQLAFGSSNTAGNLLVYAAITFFNNTNTFTFTDTIGNTILTNTLTAFGNLTVQIAYVQNCMGGANTVKVTPSVGLSSTFLAIAEYSGIVTIGAVDQFNAGTSTGTFAFSSGTTGTLSSANELVIGVAGFANSNEVLNTQSIPTRSSQATGTPSGFLMDEIVSVNTGVINNGTMSVSANTIAQVVTFIGAASTVGGGNTSWLCTNLSINQNLRGLRY